MEAASIVLFGATGDLAMRKLYPALFNLYMDGKIPSTFSVIGLGRREWTDEYFQSHIAKALNAFSRRKPDETLVREFVQAFRYCALDVNNSEDYTRLKELVVQREQQLGLAGNRLFYLSVGPEFFATIAEQLIQSGLGETAGWKRLVIEKPFGRDLASARELNEKLSHFFSEEEVYRIDHYLGKPMVQNLEVLEYSNPVIHALWSNRYIANVQITAAETVGVEERAGYYDKTGAIRDMFQNHMLQLLMMTTMHLPNPSTPEEVRRKKKSVLESLRPLQPEDIAAHVIRGQYQEGVIAGQAVQGYLDEPGIEPYSQNDTFIAAKLWIDNHFWKGIPIYIRTGKRMQEKSTRIVVQFKDPMESYNDPRHTTAEPNLLVIEINPNEGISLQLNTKDADHPGQFVPVRANSMTHAADMPEAYENLIFDALRGDATFFAHWDEVELSWAWVQPILEAFEANALPLYTYKAGSNGPEAAHELLGSDKWWLDKEPEVEAAGEKLQEKLVQI